MIKTKTLGMQLISSVLSTEDLSYLSDQLIRESLSEQEKEIWGFVFEYYKEHKSLPSLAAIESEKGILLPKAEDTPSFYRKALLEEFQVRELIRELNSLNPCLSKDTRDLLYVRSKLFSLLSMMTRYSKNQGVLDFRDAKNILAEYLSGIYTGNSVLYPVGWPTFDEMSGGIGRGEVVSIVGRPAMGKTWLTIFMALNLWSKGLRVMFVSMEMPATAIANRLISLHTSTPASWIKSGNIPSLDLKKLMTTIELIKDKENPLWILDGRFTATVDHLVMMAASLGVDAVVIDGAYLVRSANKSLGKWDAMSDVIHRLTVDLALGLEIPLVVSYQLNRNSTVNKDASMGVDMIYGSDAIGQLSSVVLALTQHEGIETCVSRQVSILKGRNGETGKFSITWDFFGMNFSEIEKNTAKEMELL